MKTLIILFCLSLLNPGRTPDATSRGEGEPSELTEMIQKSFQLNAELKMLGAELAAEQSRLGPAGTLDDPMLAVEAMNVPIDSFRMNQSEMSGIQISLAQKFPFPGKRDARQGVINLRTKTLEQRIKQMQLEIASNIKRLYYDLYLKRQKMNILENQRSFLKQTLVASRTQYVLNQLPQAAILNLQVEEAQLVNEQLRLSTETKDSEAELAHITGHAEHFPKLTFQQLKITPIDLKKWSEEDIMGKVVTQNFELRALQNDVVAQDAAVALAKKNYLPDIEVMASYTIRDKVQGMESLKNGQDMIGAKVGISIPIWGASKQSEQIKEALADREKASYILENSRLMQIHQARALFAELKESVQRMELFESGLLQLSRQAVASGRSAYLTGKMEYTAMLDTLKRQQNTEYGYQEAIVSYQVQLAKLEALLGQPLGAGI